MKVLRMTFLVTLVPRRGRRTYFFVSVQLLILGLKLKSGPGSGLLRSEGRHLYLRANFKLNRTDTLTEWRQLPSV